MARASLFCKRRLADEVVRAEVAGVKMTPRAGIIARLTAHHLREPRLQVLARIARQHRLDGIRMKVPVTKAGRVEARARSNEIGLGARFTADVQVQVKRYRLCGLPTLGIVPLEA